MLTRRRPALLTIRASQAVGAVPQHGGVDRQRRAGRKPGDALLAADPSRLQEIWDRYAITDVQVLGSVARGADEPGSDLDLLFRGPETFSLFTMIDLADDLEALLGVPVDLVSNHPDNQGRTMEAIRAAAIPLAEILARLHDMAVADRTEPEAEQAESPGLDPISTQDIDDAIERLGLADEFAANAEAWSEWGPQVGIVTRFRHDPETGDIENLLAFIEQQIAQGRIVDVKTFPRQDR